MPLYALAFIGPSGGKVYVQCPDDPTEPYGVSTRPHDATKFSCPADAVGAAETILGAPLNWDLLTNDYCYHRELVIRIEQVAPGHEFEP